MDKLKQWVALTAVGALLLAVAGWFLLVAPKRSEAADVRTQVVSAQQANGALTTQLAALKAQSKDLPRQQAKLAAVAARIPDNPNLPSLIRALNRAAEDAGVELVTLAPTSPTPYSAGAVTVPVAGSRSGAVPTSPNASSGLHVVGVSVNVVGGYFQIEQFFDRVENISRAFKVTGFTLAPGDSPVNASLAVQTGAPASETGKSLSATLTGQVFVAPAAAAATAPVTATVPTPAQ